MERGECHARFTQGRSWALPGHGARAPAGAAGTAGSLAAPEKGAGAATAGPAAAAAGAASYAAADGSAHSYSGSIGCTVESTVVAAGRLQALRTWAPGPSATQVRHACVGACMHTRHNLGEQLTNGVPLQCFLVTRSDCHGQNSHEQVCFSPVCHMLTKFALAAGLDHLAV